MWLIFHFFLMQEGEFGPEQNPLEPWWLKLHGLFAFAAIFTFGLLWAAHITKGWSMRRRRWSGGALVSLMGWMLLTGYLLYYLGDETLRSWTSILHWSAGLALPIGFLAHRLIRFEAKPAPLPNPAE